MKEALRKYWHFYLAALLFALGLFFLGKAYSYENPHAIANISNFHHVRSLKFEDCTTFARKVIFHRENAERCYRDAEKRCWYIPDITARRNADYCLSNAGALCYPGTPQSKLIAVMINTMVQYGLDCCEEWHHINNKLYWAQYHYEMMEFYQDLIAKGEE